MTQTFSQEAESQHCMSCDKRLGSEERLLAKSNLNCQKKDVLRSEAAPVMARNLVSLCVNICTHTGNFVILGPGRGGSQNLDGGPQLGICVSHLRRNLPFPQENPVLY